MIQFWGTTICTERVYHLNGDYLGTGETEPRGNVLIKSKFVRNISIPYLCLVNCSIITYTNRDLIARAVVDCNFGFKSVGGRDKRSLNLLDGGVIIVGLIQLNISISRVCALWRFMVEFDLMGYSDGRVSHEDEEGWRFNASWICWSLDDFIVNCGHSY